jgi:LacI family transcriptional regulator
METLTTTRATRNDVARKAGVSTATVSYVINNGPRRVSDEAREKVLKAVRELGYQPNRIAQSLRLQEAFVIGVILPDTSNSYFAEVARSIERVAFEQRFSVSLGYSAYEPERELQYAERLLSERAAGVIWVPSTADSRVAQRLRAHGVPLVLLDRNVPGQEDLPTIDVDNFRGAYLATEYLIRQGHRRIAHITRRNELGHSSERLRGYCEALRDNGVRVDESLIRREGFDQRAGRDCTLGLLGERPAPTAIFAYNDVSAVGVLRAAYERNVRVPQELSVVGFDDITEASFTCPALTTVAQPKSELGRIGAELLLRLIRGEQPGHGERITEGVSVVVRESSGPAPQGEAT